VFLGWRVENNVNVHADFNPLENGILTSGSDDRQKASVNTIASPGTPMCPLGGIPEGATSGHGRPSMLLPIRLPLQSRGDQMIRPGLATLRALCHQF
jgi:hypothetical protein